MVNPRLILAFVFVLTGPCLGSRTIYGGTPPSPLTWYNLLAQKPPATGDGAYIHHLLILLGAKDGHALTREIEAGEFSADTYLDLVSQRDTEYRYLFNRRGENIQDYHPSSKTDEELFAQIFRFTYADTILHAPEGGERWGIYRAGDKGGVKKEFIAKGPDDTSAAGIKKWLLEKLGYSGVVLAHDDAYLLVGIYKEIKEGESAMMLRESENTLRVKNAQVTGGALLRRMDCHETICVFKIMIDSNNKYLPGAKVVF